MSLHRITVRIEGSIHEQLEHVAQASGMTQPEIIRAAIKDYLRRQLPTQTCYDVAKRAGVIGCVKGGPRDMSTNPKHMEGFGRD